MQGQTSTELYVIVQVWGFFLEKKKPAQCEERPVGLFWLGDTIFSSVRSLKIKARIIARIALF